MVVKTKWDNPNKCLVWHLEHRKFSEVSQHIIIVQRRNRPPFETGSPPELNWKRYVNWGPNVEFTSTPGLPISSMPLQHLHTIQNKNVVSVVDVFSCKTFFFFCCSTNVYFSDYLCAKHLLVDENGKGGPFLQEAEHLTEKSRLENQTVMQTCAGFRPTIHSVLVFLLKWHNQEKGQGNLYI